MKRIGLISDTHGYLDEKVFKYFEDCDELWHAGDFGTLEVAKKLETFRLLKGVFGNIDGKEIREEYPESITFMTEGVKVFMTHIAGPPLKYNKIVKAKLMETKPNLLICGHSHILRVVTDKKLNNLLYINPGAAGNQGFHKIKTIIKFDLHEGKIENMKAIELGQRGLS